MDYNEYTYCYGGGRGGWHFFPLFPGPAAHHRAEPVRVRRGTNEIFHRSWLDCAIRRILWHGSQAGLVDVCIVDAM